jgi:hypothetical protein
MQKITTILSIIILVAFKLSANSGFSENKGQITEPSGKVNEDVLFIGHTKDLKVTLRKNGFSYEVVTTDLSNDEINRLVNQTELDFSIPYMINRIDFKFPQAPSSIEAKNQVQGYQNNYLNGKEVKNIRSYNQIIYKDVSQGTDIVFTISDVGFKYDLVFHETEYLNSFFLDINGSLNTRLMPNGKLRLETGGIELYEEIPLSFGLVAGKKVKSLARYNYKTDESRLYFERIGNEKFDSFIIDPQPEIIWGTHFGGPEYDITTRIAVDSEGNISQTGLTLSMSNISTSGAFQESFSGGLDVFVSKFLPNGNLAWSSYIGGPQTDRAYGIITTSDNAVLVGGTSFSEFGIATPGAYQEVVNGLDDAFIIKFDGDGNRIWGTYYGGNNHDFITFMQTDPLGRIYLTGHTKSSNHITTPGAFIENMVGTECGLLASFSSSGNLIWGTYIGESSNTSGEGIVYDDGFIYLGGRTASTGGIASSGSHQENKVGFQDAFLMKFSDAGTRIWGTYYGGDFADQGAGVTVDDNNNVYLIGNASSLNNIATPGSYQPTRMSSEDGFLVKFNSDGQRQWGTYIGGIDTDYLRGVTYLNGEVICAGYTLSSTNIATIGAHQSIINGGYEGFIKSLDTSGLHQWGTYFGGENDDNINTILADSKNNLLISGTSTSPSNIHYGNGFQSSFGGGSNDGFIAKFCVSVAPTIYFENGQIVSSEADEYTWYLNGEPISFSGNPLIPTEDGDYYVVTSNNGKCEVQSNVYTHSTIGIKNNELDGLKIYPNPFSSILNILSNESIESLEIYDILGAIYFEESTINKLKISIDLSNIPSGTYFLKVYTDSGLRSTVLIKD